MMSRVTRPSAIAVLWALLVAGLAGCGGDDSSAPDEAADVSTTSAPITTTTTTTTTSAPPSIEEQLADELQGRGFTAEIPSDLLAAGQAVCDAVEAQAAVDGFIDDNDLPAIEGSWLVTAGFDEVVAFATDGGLSADDAVRLIVASATVVCPEYSTAAEVWAA